MGSARLNATARLYRALQSEPVSVIAVDPRHPPADTPARLSPLQAQNSPLPATDLVAAKNPFPSTTTCCTSRRGLKPNARSSAAQQSWPGCRSASLTATPSSRRPEAGRYRLLQRPWPSVARGGIGPRPARKMSAAAHGALPAALYAGYAEEEDLGQASPTASRRYGRAGVKIPRRPPAADGAQACRAAGGPCRPHQRALSAARATGACFCVGCFGSGRRLWAANVRAAARSAGDRPLPRRRRAAVGCRRRSAVPAARCAESAGVFISPEWAAPQHGLHSLVYENFRAKTASERRVQFTFLLPIFALRAKKRR